MKVDQERKFIEAQYGRCVYQWIKQFETGQKSMKNEERVGHPASATTDVNNEQAYSLILNNSQVAVDELANHMNISHGSAY